MKNFDKNAVYRYFQMGILTTALTMVRKDFFIARFDFTNAYYSVLVALGDQKYLLLFFRGQLYRYVLSLMVFHGFSGPRVFTKILKPLSSAHCISRRTRL